MYWNINAYILDKKDKTDIRHTIADNFSIISLNINQLFFPFRFAFEYFGFGHTA